MQETLTIHIPGEIRQMLNRTQEELSRDMRLYTALMLFRTGKLSSGAAAEMAGMPRVMFLPSNSLQSQNRIVYLALSSG